MKIASLRAGVFVVAMAVLVAGLVFDRHATLAAYLVAWTGLGSIPIGALGILMTAYLVRWSWTLSLRPILIPVLATLPAVALLFLPILAWMAELYPAAADPASLPPFKAAYLSPWLFALRAIAYFVTWSLLALWLRKAGRDSERMTRAASAGIIIYVLSLSLAGVDWLESLDPDFHSSIYGLLFVSFAMLNGLAFAIAAGLRLRRHIGSLKGYSALLLSAILIWAYLHAMQYIVIWSGNIPDEVTWYLERSSHGWQFVLAGLALGQFVLPFFALLSETIRGDRRWLFGLCGLTLVMRVCEAAILILPAVPSSSPLMVFVMMLAALGFVGTALWWTFEAALNSELRAIIPFAVRLRAETAPE
jgi:hypothetical protein